MVNFERIVTGVFQGDVSLLDQLDNPKVHQLIDDLVHIRLDPQRMYQKYAKKLGIEGTNSSDQIECDPDNFTQRFLCLTILIRSSIYLGKTDMLDLFEEAIDELEEIQNEQQIHTYTKLTTTELFSIAQFYDKLFHQYWYKGDHHKALVYGEYALNIYQHLDFAYFEYSLRANLVLVTAYFNHSEELLEEYHEILDYFEHQDNLRIVISIESNLISLLASMGRIAEATERNRKLVEKLEEFERRAKGDPLMEQRFLASQYIAKRINAMLETIKGNFEESIVYSNEALELFNQVYQDDLGKARILIDIGYSYYQLNQYEESFGAYSEAMGILQRIGNPSDISNLMFKMILLEIDLGEEYNLSELLYEFNQLEVAEDDNVKDGKYQYLVNYAKIKSEELVEILTAASGFENILQPNVSFELRVNSIFLITAIWLLEYSVIPSKQKNQQIRDNLKLLKEMAEGEHLPNLLVEVKLMTTFHALIQGNTQQITSILNEIEHMLREEGLLVLINRLDTYRYQVENMMQRDGHVDYYPLFKFFVDKYKSMDREGDSWSQNEDLEKEEELEYNLLLHPDRLNILISLEQNNDLSTREIMQINDIPKSTARRQIILLEENQLIYSELDLSRARPTRVFNLTIEGLRVLNSFRNSIQSTL